MNARTALRAVGVLAIVVAVFMMLDMTWVRAYLGGADSQLRLAYAYGTGGGVEIDQKKATDWYRKAAEQGDPRGQMALAARLDDGQGVAVDVAAATKWYEKAATTGDAAAQLAMAIRFHQGKGAPQDDVRSAMWLILSDRYAARRSDGVELLGALKASLTEEQLAEARRIAADWRAAHPGALRPPEEDLSAQAPVEAP